MFEKKKITIVLLIVGLLIVFKILEYHQLFPGQVGRMIVNNGASATTIPLQEKESKAMEELSPDTSRSSPVEETSPQEEDSFAEEKNQAAKINLDTEQYSQTIATAATVGKEDARMFYITELTKEIKDRITGISYADHCIVPYEELCYVQVLYWGFDEETHTGELIVGKAIAEDIVDIFKELYAVKYPIERMVLIDDYNAEDNASMAANNSSAFCYRVIDNGSNKLSNHSYGLAIDINPLYNPYVRERDGKTVVSPEEGAKYEDRTLDCKYYIQKDDVCYQAFISRGFTWGGDWKNQKDYQHFQKVLD